MRYQTMLLAAAVMFTPLPVLAQGPAGQTQTRDGLGTGGHTASPTNAAPAGSENANTGPQAKPAYPSGSSTPNPGSAFLGTQPKPATGALAKPPGALTTTTTSGNGHVTTRPGPGPASEGAGVAPRTK